MKNIQILAFTSAFLCSQSIAKPGDEVYQKGYLSQEKALQSIQLKDGYSLELVLSDPQIKEPVAMAWDGNGALYVVEMRTYMQDAEATGEQEPTSRISKHVDTDGDGVYDKHTVFVDNLLLPRRILALDDRLMVGITNTLDLWNYTDTDGDGVADKKEKIYLGGDRGGNMEHQPSGLVWNLDNWIYSTYEAKRYRFTNGELVVEDLPKGGGQWGLGKDNAGRLYYSAAGGERPAYFFQQPIVYGALNLSDQQQEAEGFRTVYPIAPVPDVQGGERRLNEHGSINHFSGGGGQAIYRGDRLPQDLLGNMLLPEPVGRLIRRASVTRQDGITFLENVYNQEEFIAARDVNFRPLWAATSPDGAMMFIDMHRGIIQQATWTQKGSYIREVIEKWGLDKNISKGRIYRLVHDSYQADQQPRMLDQSTSELVAHLAHPNGWWRDTAQKLITLRDDRLSVVPGLEALLSEHSSELGRLHALWTLEGIGALTQEHALAALKDSSSLVRTSGIRVAEPFLKQGDATVVAALTSNEPLKDDMEMVIQAINSINYSETENPELLAFSSELAKTHRSHPVVSRLKQMQNQVKEAKRKAEALRQKNAAFAASMEKGGATYQQLCSACHGADGTGAPMPGIEGHYLAPGFARNPRVMTSQDTALRSLIHGVQGDLDGKQYEGIMAAMGSSSDEWVADVTTYIRNAFGNESEQHTQVADVQRVRKMHEGRTAAWTQEELETLVPSLLPQEDWTLTASHAEKGLKGCIDDNPETRYTTQKSMEPGMWIQVEFPSEVNISGLVLDYQKSKNDYARGYEVTVSQDGKRWSTPVSKGEGKPGKQKILFPQQKAKFMRMTQTGQNGSYWSVHELSVIGKEI